MADPDHPGFKPHRPAYPNDANWVLKIKDVIKVKRDPSAPDWHLPPARAVVIARNDAYTYRVKILEAGKNRVENVSVDRLVATSSKQKIEEAIQLRDECHKHGIPERGRGWCTKEKQKSGCVM